nr:GPN-loop GTPase 2 [Tanacetum cinerariifolium]
MVFGQVVIGPPGSGKTTYCNGMQQFLQLIGRKVAVINLDPANDSLPYDCAINIEDLIKLSDVMNEHSLGPNGGLLYCMDYLEKNIDWLESKLKPLLKEKLDLRLTAIHLIDSHLCSDPGKYVSALLLTLSTMLHMELPHVNVLSKMDLIESYGKLAFNLDFYTDVEDLSYLQNHLDQDPRSSKYRKLTKELCEKALDCLLDDNSTTAAVQEKYMKDDEFFDSDEESNNNEYGNLEQKKEPQGKVGTQGCPNQVHKPGTEVRLFQITKGEGSGKKDGSERKSYYSSRRETKSCYQTSRSKETEIAFEKHRHKREYSRRTEAESESEGSAKGHWKSKPKKQKSSMEDDLSQPWVCEETDPFTPRIRYFDFPKTRMPSHIKTYDGSEDPEDHLKIFQAAAKTERWAMPTWCHMFNSTLTGNARVWFDDVPKESIDSYDDLRKAFLENYLQQKKCIKDPVEIHNIKQRNGESTKEFVRRYKIECRDVKGSSECMKISGFMHGITNPELINRLHDKIPKSMDEMM